MYPWYQSGGRPRPESWGLGGILVLPCHFPYSLPPPPPTLRNGATTGPRVGGFSCTGLGGALPRGERDSPPPPVGRRLPLDAIKKGTPPEVAAGPSRRRQRVRTSATRQRDSPAATPNGSRTKSFSVRRLTECPRSPRNSGQRWCEGVPPRLTRAAGTPTTQDPVILGRRVGSPKPNKNRATDRWPCGTS